MRLPFLFGSLVIAAVAVAQTQKSSDVAAFVTVDTPVFVLNHVRVIDGTGAAAKDDQAIVIANGKIQSIGPAASAQIPQGAQLLDRSGYTVIPGLVGMHDHLYYTDSIAVQVADGRIGEPGLFVAEIPYTAPRLYLAAGVTTMRTSPFQISTRWIRASKATKYSASSWLAFGDVLLRRSRAGHLNEVRASGCVVHDQDLRTLHP